MLYHHIGEKLIKTDTQYVNIQSEQDNFNAVVKAGQTWIPIDKLTNRLIYDIIREKSAKHQKEILKKLWEKLTSLLCIVCHLFLPKAQSYCLLYI